MSCLVILAQSSPKPAAWRHVCVFGYVSELSTEHITAGLQLLIARGREWEESSPIFVLNADVKAAFNNMRPDTIAISLHRAQQHPRITAAMVQEMAGLSCLPEFEGITLEEPTRFNKCARQGGMESTCQWNCVMYMCFCDLVPAWIESGYGIVLGDKCYTHLVWADNIWLLSHDLGHIQTMLNSLTGMLSECKLAWKPDSLQVMCSMSTLPDSFSLWVQNEELVVEAVSSMEVLRRCLH